MEGEEALNESQDSIRLSSIIKIKLADGPLLQTRHISKPFEIWKALENLYSPKDFSSKFLLCKDLFDTTLQKSSYRMGLYLN